MSDADGTTYNIVFRGDIAPGESMVDVKQRVAQLFKIDDERADQLFSGRPVVLKKNLDLVQADQYRQALERAGAVVEVKEIADAVAVDTNPVTEPEAGASQSEGELSLSEPGADVLAPEERKEFVPAELNLDHLSMGEAGEDVLAESEKKPFVAKDVDTSHLSLDDN